jgi:lipopolysaccharide biosynthesis regulator YciM
VHVDKDEIVDLLRSRGEHDKAATVGCALPRRVDTEADAGLLSQYDLNVREVAAASTEGRDGHAPT